jgi:hypothetical protein
MDHSLPRTRRFFTLASLVLLAAAGCSSSDSSSGGNQPSGLQGAPADGPADTHCHADGGTIANPTDMAECTPDAGAAADAGADPGPDYGPTIYGTEGDDDDCKYHVKYTVSPIYENWDVTFTVTATKTVDGTPLTGASPRAEVYLDDKHPAPNTGSTATETSPGTYSVGPIQFDAPGRWTVRFHFYEDCSDLSELSPHGHAAFYIDVK